MHANTTKDGLQGGAGVFTVASRRVVAVVLLKDLCAKLCYVVLHCLLWCVVLALTCDMQLPSKPHDRDKLQRAIV
jgi:hypothetical protein